jgi:hypothetical protein
MADIRISYGNFDFLSASGYPTPNLSVSTNQVRTPAGDYLMSEKTITLDGMCYAARKTVQNQTSAPTASQKDTTVNGLFLLASGLHDKILQNNHSGLKIYLINRQSDNYLINDIASIDTISFKENENNWRNSIDYSIVLKVYSSGSGSYLTKDGGHYVTSVTDTYNLQLIDNDKYLYQDKYIPVYKLTRTIGAVGKRITSTSGALYHAKQWVIDRQAAAPLTGMFRTSDFLLYNQEREISVDEPGGSYSITDSFIAKSGYPWIDNYSITTVVDYQFNRTISINGFIQGLEPATGIYDSRNIDISTTNGVPNSTSGKLDIYPAITGINGYAADNGKTNLFTYNIGGSNLAMGKSKYMNAVSGYNIVRSNIFNRALAYNTSTTNLISSDWDGQNYFSNYKTRPLNPLPLSLTESLYPFEGKITYQAEYDSRPLSIMTGAISETFSFTEKLPSIRVQEIQILGRRLGPLVYEYYGSSGIGNRTVSYEAVFPRETGLKGYSFPQGIINAIDNTLLSYQPLPPFTGNLQEDSQQIFLTENKIVCTKSWNYTKCPDY